MQSSWLFLLLVAALLHPAASQQRAASAPSPQICQRRSKRLKRALLLRSFSSSKNTTQWRGARAATLLKKDKTLRRWRPRPQLSSRHSKPVTWQRIQHQGVIDALQLCLLEIYWLPVKLCIELLDNVPKFACCQHDRFWKRLDAFFWTELLSLECFLRTNSCPK